MINAIIIEDHAHCIRRLERLIGNHTPNINLVGIFDNIIDAIRDTPKLKPDLVFLDIKVKNRTGFEYLEAIKERNFNIIFTTGYDSYYKKAFNYSAIDYLEKPIDKEEFLEAIKKYNDNLIKAYGALKIQTLLDNYNKQGQNKEINIEYSGNFNKVKLKDIITIEKNNSLINLQTAQREITLSKSLSFYQKLLEEHYFFRINHHQILNLKYITSYNSYENKLDLTLYNDKRYSVSVRKKQEFLKVYKKFVGNSL